MLTDEAGAGAVEAEQEWVSVLPAFEEVSEECHSVGNSWIKSS